MNDSIDVVTFYDEHPINLSEILGKAESNGLSLDSLTAADLWEWDQDHYGGLEAVDALAESLGIKKGSRVIDLCCGLGGPARYLATTIDCSVHGVDLNQTRVDGATELTRLVKLNDQVSFSEANVCELPMADGTFDIAMSQEAFLHIEDRESLLAECHRVLCRGGRLGFTDWIADEALNAAHRKRFSDTFAASRIVSVAEYKTLLSDAGFRIESITDLSDQWRSILVERLGMFRSLEKETVAKFGQERHNTYISNYEFFVERITETDLGGARIVAIAL